MKRGFALMQEPCAQVYSKETLSGYLSQRIEVLAEKGRSRLKELGFDNDSIVLEVHNRHSLLYSG